MHFGASGGRNRAAKKARQAGVERVPELHRLDSPVLEAQLGDVAYPLRPTTMLTDEQPRGATGAPS